MPRESAGRQLVVAGRAMHRIIEVAIETGYLPQNFKYHDQEHFSYLEPDEVVLLCTGSQGEPRAAMARIAEDEHPDIELDKGDLVIFSSRTIPGNERAVGRIQNRLVDLGCELVTDGDALVHVTGHPRREELKEMYGWVQAAHRHSHARRGAASGRARQARARGGRAARCFPSATATSCGWRRAAPRSSTRRRSGGCSATGTCWCRARTGRCASAARWPLPASSSWRWPHRARGELSGRSRRWCSTACPPADAEGRPMLDIVRDAVEGTIASIPRDRRKDAEMVREAVRRAVRSAVEDAWGKRPIVKVLLTQVPGKR